MKARIYPLMLGWILAATSSSAAVPVHVRPNGSFSKLRERLAKDAEIRKVILVPGAYFGGPHVEVPKGADFSQRPLLIGFGAETCFSGTMADLRLYAGAMKAEEVVQIHANRTTQ
jgi:hypothetical protein